MDIRKINFGKADALEEGFEYPQLLKDGYLDSMNLVERIKSHTTFLFLGYKGSGKSALSEHIRLIADNEKTIVDQQQLTQFPYKSFAKIVSGDAEPEVKYHTAWKWLLLIKVLDNLISDSKAVCGQQEKLDKIIEALNKLGLIPMKTISNLVLKSSTVSVKAHIPKLMEIEKSSRKENAELGINSAISMLENIILSFSECREQFIIIDGLDDILTSRDIQFSTIAALLNEVKILNRFFYEHNMPIKLIVLCRTDIFERLHDPNKNKIRQDCSFSFTWYKEGITTHENNDLIRIANIRTQLVYPECENIFVSLFPKKMNNEDIYSLLLEYTRHTPRDFMQLLVNIQKYCDTNSVTQKAIEDGLKEYSVEYFLPEIKDEMEGYVSQTEIEYMVKVLSTLRKIEFEFYEVLPIADEIGKMSKEKLINCFNVLYDCSAIGHIYQRNSSDGLTFKYRNRHSNFSSGDKIRIHKGLWKALNVNF